MSKLHSIVFFAKCKSEIRIAIKIIYTFTIMQMIAKANFCLCSSSLEISGELGEFL